MTDFLFMLLLVIAFAAAAGYVRLCSRLTAPVFPPQGDA
jgi:hypothetical protein